MSLKQSNREMLIEVLT